MVTHLAILVFSSTITTDKSTELDARLSKHTSGAPSLSQPPIAVLPVAPTSSSSSAAGPSVPQRNEKEATSSISSPSEPGNGMYIDFLALRRQLQQDLSQLTLRNRVPNQGRGQGPHIRGQTLPTHPLPLPHPQIPHTSAHSRTSQFLVHPSQTPSPSGLQSPLRSRRSTIRIKPTYQPSHQTYLNVPRCVRSNGL